MLAKTVQLRLRSLVFLERRTAINLGSEAEHT